MNKPTIKILISPAYLAEQSNPAQDRYLFSYTINIANDGDEAIQLLERFWRLTDGNQKIREVRGPGVVGEQPIIEPGEAFEYTSGTDFETPVGVMEGEYQMQTASGKRFKVPIPPFRFAKPGVMQ